MSIQKALRLVLVGGTWDRDGGRPSSYVAQLAAELKHLGCHVDVRNGGTYAGLVQLAQGALPSSDAILWFAHVPNQLAKHRNLKKSYPTALLVLSKYNDGRYALQDLVNRSLGLRANLQVEFVKNGNRIYARLLDPLAVLWQPFTDNIVMLAHALRERLCALRCFTRVASTQVSEQAAPVPAESEFFHVIRRHAETYHRLIMPASGVKRFLGNASFRCTNGFPSFRSSSNGHIFVSARNVDKRQLGSEMFVAVTCGRDNTVSYLGARKPSVDTPIQLALYEKLPRINYMLHAHVYVEGAPFTSAAIPCGALEEADAILALIDPGCSVAAVNLRGHGSLVLAEQVDAFRQVTYRARPQPETL